MLRNKKRVIKEVEAEVGRRIKRKIKKGLERRVIKNTNLKIKNEKIKVNPEVGNNKDRI